jgi:hypothetical protein
MAGGLFGENAELGEKRFAAVHVRVVLAAPGKGLGALALLETRGVDSLEVRERRAELRREVIAHGGDDADRAVEACRGGEVGAGAAEDLLAVSGGCGDGVDADCAGDDEWHRAGW